MASLVGLDESEPIPPTNDPAERIRLEAASENTRTGGFQRLYPNADVERYLPFFSLPRLADAVLADAMSVAPVKRPRLQRRYATEVITGDQLALYDEQTGRLSQLNETASLIWLMAMEGADPDSIAEQLARSAAAVNSGDSPNIWTIRKDVWDCLADWAHMGLLSQKADTGHGVGEIPVRRERASGPAHKPALDTTPYVTTLSCVAQRVEFHTDSQPVAARMEALFSPLKTESGNSASSRLEVVRDTPGYTLTLDGEVIESRITLAAIGPALSVHLARRTPGKGEMVMDAGLVQRQNNNAGSIIFASTRHGLGDTLALQFAERHDLGFARGLLFDTLAFDRSRAMGLPGQGKGRLVPASRACLPGPHWIEAVIIPCVQDPPREPSIQTLSAGEALRELLPACFLAGGEPIDAKTLGTLMDWLSGRKLYSVDVSDFEAAIEALTHYLNSTRSSLELTSAT